MRVMTWNTGLYREPSCETTSEKYQNVARVVKNFLEQGDGVCFLQEIPYKSSQTWEEHSLFTALKRDFPDSQYDMLFHITSKHQIMMTVALAFKQTIERAESAIPDWKNRHVTVLGKKGDKLKLTGIHAANGADNALYLAYLCWCDSDVILGDFNAGDYEESGNRLVFNRILRGYVCLCDEITRCTEGQRATPIDHVFVRQELAPRCTPCVVHKEIVCSDHYPVTFEILAAAAK